MSIIGMIRPCARLGVLALLVLAGCGGSSSSSEDFTLSVSPVSLQAFAGTGTQTAYLSVADSNGFDDKTTTANVSVSGLPAGATTNPAFPISITTPSGSPNSVADACMLDPHCFTTPFTISTTSATPAGTFTLTLHATNGSHSHDVTMTLLVNPPVQTSQQGSVLYLQAQANGHTARIGLDTAWGGGIVEVSLDGTNFVNRHDTGRLVQPALYDGADQYPDLGPGSAYGWDPVLAGDSYGHGSTVLQQTISTDSLFTSTAPLQWWPDNFGGGASMPVAADMTFEQTVTAVPGASVAFKVHFKLSHYGTDTHYNSGQEFPAVYVNSTYTTLAYYGGSSPWTNGAVTTRLATPYPSNPSPAVYVPEQWGALVDANNQGLAVFVPGQYPQENAWAFDNQSGTGPLGNTTIYMVPSLYRTIAPGAVIEGDIYLVPGDLGAARTAIYAIHDGLPVDAKHDPPDISAPLTSIDEPVAGATISGNATLSGWAFDNVNLLTVSIYIDGTAMGDATMGLARPDVANAYPRVAPPDSGWSFMLDTTKLSNGPHSIEVHAMDWALIEAINAPVAVTVQN